MSQKINEREMAARLLSHLKKFGSNDESTLLWHGYLAACIEWGLLSPNEHLRLSKVLRDIGHQELAAVFLGTDE